LLSLKNYDFKANVHLFKSRDLNILLDVNSGAIHVLDEPVYRLIKNLIELQGDWEKARQLLIPEFPARVISEAETELKQACEEGLIFTEAQDLDLDLASFYVKALCLNVAHSCNMKCRYCFASQGSFGLAPSLMTLETGQKALDFLIEKSGPIRNLEVDFFGGEPLLVADMLKHLVAYGRQREKETHKHFNFTLTTNCSLLDQDMIDFVIANDISVILSLDGRKEINDLHRVFNNGQGSYDRIVPKIKRMVEHHPRSYFVRGTFTRKNLDFASDLKHMVELGFDCISIEPAVGPDNGYSIQAEDLPQVLAEYERLTDFLMQCREKGQEVLFFHYNLQLQGGPCLAKRMSGCGAGIEYLVITPEGDIYPCHQFVGEKDFYMGNISQGIIDRKIRQRFEKNQIKDKECSQCWTRYFCGGGCHANAYFINKDMSKPEKVSCRMQQKRVEEAIYMEVVKNLQS